ncbi:cysteine--tRNA ligase [Clostridium sp. JN-9]|uniref:cysteine--tRNA ligase n=1 Tax=Clostridium sp. JN-9 TaxID=2507159 RepID=UPI000FFE27F3|nr:cysteine--tRNA ligase [Clostridium sp. JN-9]QAT41276.1 cysteine--tRNA ligase [Clostridium sp. JN-9]
MDFYVYNTLTRNKEKLIPYREGRIGMYTCGPTVYNYAHIGNLRTYIFEDTLKKALKYNGFKVKHVMNITDVGHLQSDGDEGEDKMALGAKRENKTPWEIARFYEKAFYDDCEKLNIEKPTVSCRATEHIDDMINLIKGLEEKGYTYAANGNVYFEIDKFKDYNKLANLSMEELQAGRRVQIDINKKNPLDFVLWFTNSKFKNQIMQWDSPWGRGFPGWHLECSTLSIKYLGEVIDIHCGGVDHIPVHHTNEIAQSESYLGHKWVNYWMHGEFLVMDGGKMSKSSGDFLTLSKLIDEGFSPLDYRYFCLNSKYRKQLLFSFDSLKDAQNSLKKLKSKTLSILKGSSEHDRFDLDLVNDYRTKFSKEINDDLNIANAITVLWEVIKDNKLTNREKLFIIEDFDKVLSLDLLKEDKSEEDNENIDLIEKLIAERFEARNNKQWAKADEIRNKLNEMNIELLDTKEGTTWKRR